MSVAKHPSIGLEHLSLYEDPVAVFVGAAADGGADSICLSVNHPDVLDPGKLPDIRSQTADLGLTVSMGDGFLLNAESGIDGLKRQLDTLVEIGSRYANACAFEPVEEVQRDPSRIHDLLGEFCRLARQADVEVLIEFTPLSHVPTLASAAELVGQLGQPNLKIMVDTLHLIRAGEGPKDIALVDPTVFGYCQLSDGRLESGSLSAYMDEAIYERAIPGEGRFPLAEIVSLLPPDIVVSAEVPLRTLKASGVSPYERAHRIIAGGRNVLAEARALPSPG